jgi:hypothetical protein
VLYPANPTLLSPPPHDTLGQDHKRKETSSFIRVVLKTVSLFLLGIEILEPTMEVFKPAAVVPDEPLEGRLGLGGAALLVR